MEKLILEAKNGNKDSFTKLIISIENDLYKIARMRFSCEADIEDAVQETIIQSYKSIKKLKKPECFKAWIIKILINNCNKIYKKNNKNIEYVEEMSTGLDIYDNNDAIISNLEFYSLIKELSYKERITLILYYSKDFTTKQISKILHEPESTIRNRISRAKIKIKKLYDKGGEYYGEHRK